MEHNYILHTGVKRKSGRYEWGSGEHPYQNEPWFKGWGDMRAKGMSEKEIAEEFGMSMKELRYRYSYAKDAEKAAQIAHIKELRYTRQMSTKAIAEKLNMSQSTVEAYLKPTTEERVRQTQDLADHLVQSANKNKDIRAIDIGKGVSNVLCVSPTKLEAAVQVLKDEGYVIVKTAVPQPQNISKKTEMMFLYSPTEDERKLSDEELNKTAYRNVMQNLDKINPPYDVYVDENGKTSIGIEPPKSVKSSRVAVSYQSPRDGMIGLRRGVKDLDLGDATYAQVRIGVDDTHYIKGVAVYLPDSAFPKGKDIIVFSNKKEGVPLLSDDDNAKQVLKPMKKDADGSVDMEDPFGAQIMKGGQSGCINKVNEEGAWSSWTSSSTLASQVLSKQDPKLAEKQLELQRTKVVEQYEEIQKITNPVVRQKELLDFAEECDKAAVHMKAAALPGQSVKVILPAPSLKEGEVYAPSYKDGDKLALIRYPHSGKHEIPILTVNNKNREGRQILGTNPADAICLNPKNAEQLSGADFDGDTVLVIPNNDRSFKTSPALKELQGFEPKEVYKRPEGTEPVKHATAQKQMGVVTNLIADMTLQKASPEEIARAVKYSMVVIDAEKHNLDYKQARKDNDIEGLQKKYQKKPDGRYGGASTLISRASAETRIPEVKKSYRPDPETGNYIYTPTGATYVDKHGRTQPKLSKMEQMRTVSDAHELSSGTVMESVYADYANKMKTLASTARKEAINSKGQVYSPEAAKTYSKEVATLDAKISQAKSHAPLERKAQLLANATVALKKADNPDMTKEQIRKHTAQALGEARAVLGFKPKIDITDSEWEAIQAGAISKTKLQQVLRYSDQDKLKARAMPKDHKGLTESQILRAKSRITAGYTISEVADQLGISTSTLQKAIYA